MVRNEMPSVTGLSQIIGVALAVNRRRMLVNPESEDISARDGNKNEHERTR